MKEQLGKIFANAVHFYAVIYPESLVSFFILMHAPIAVKAGGPARLGPALTGFGLYRAGPKSPVEKRA